MKFLKLHQNGCELILNLSMVSEIYPVPSSNKSDLYMNFAIDGEQASFRVDEPADEILRLSRKAGAVFVT